MRAVTNGAVVANKRRDALTRAPTVADASRRSWMLRIAWHFALLERAISEVPLCIMVAVRSMAARLADLDLRHFIIVAEIARA